MTAKEKKLLWIAGLIFFGYALPFEAWPAVNQWVGQHWEQLQAQKTEIDRLRRLLSQREQWIQENATARQHLAEIEAALLQGETRDVVGARLQSLLKDNARKTGTQITSLDLAEFAQTQDWLLISQSLRFEANSQQLLDFLHAIKNDPIALSVVTLDVSVVRVNQVSGTLKITGFSHLIQDKPAAATEKSS